MFVSQTSRGDDLILLPKPWLCARTASTVCNAAAIPLRDASWFLFGGAYLGIFNPSRPQKWTPYSHDHGTTQPDIDLLNLIAIFLRLPRLRTPFAALFYLSNCVLRYDKMLTHMSLQKNVHWRSKLGDNRS